MSQELNPQSTVMHSCYDKCALCEYFTSFTFHYLHILHYNLCIFHITLFTYYSIYIFYIIDLQGAILMYFLSFFLADANFRLANFKL